MASVTCPSCGAEVPLEAGQHAPALAARVVDCPTCGASVRLEDAGEAGGEAPRAEAPPEVGEDFSGHETVEGVMDELEGKEGGGA